MPVNCPQCRHVLRDDARFCDSCGLAIASFNLLTTESPDAGLDPSPPASSTDPLLGHLLEDKYELIARLGEGGMGTVYRARRIRIGDEVAVKVLHRRFVAEATALERFRREARAAARLHHPNVVTIHDFGEARGQDAPAFIVMELLEGETLRSLLEREIRLEQERGVSLMCDICTGVGAAHRRDIVHRDLKPDNIIIRPPDVDHEREIVKVVDFGIAKLRDMAAGNTLTQTGALMGTPYYMSPEQCRGEPLDARSDVYSLGIMLYEMLAGVPPFTAETVYQVMKKHEHDSPPPLPSRLGVGKPLEAVIMRALTKEPDPRPADATLFARELQAAHAEHQRALQEERRREEERQRAEELRLEEERQRVEAAERQRAEEEARRQAEAARQRAEAEARARAEEEERRRAEEERRQVEEEARLRAEEEARQRRAAEAARQRAEAEERARAEEEERQRVALEEQRRAAEEEAARQRTAEEEKRQREEEETRQRAAAAARQQAAEELKKQEEARQQAAEEESRQRIAEEERKRKEEETKGNAKDNRLRPPPMNDEPVRRGLDDAAPLDAEKKETNRGRKAATRKRIDAVVDRLLEEERLEKKAAFRRSAMVAVLGTLLITVGIVYGWKEYSSYKREVDNSIAVNSNGATPNTSNPPEPTDASAATNSNASPALSNQALDVNSNMAVASSNTSAVNSVVNQTVNNANLRAPVNVNANTSSANNGLPLKVESPGTAPDSPNKPVYSTVSITSDVPLKDYSAYRSGNRFYVVLPDTASANVQNTSGPGFDDVKVRKSGNESVVMFTLKPGVKASVRQRFNKLEVVFSTPGKVTGTADNANANF